GNPPGAFQCWQCWQSWQCSASHPDWDNRLCLLVATLRFEDEREITRRDRRERQIEWPARGRSADRERQQRGAAAIDQATRERDRPRGLAVGLGSNQQPIGPEELAPRIDGRIAGGKGTDFGGAGSA